MNANENLNNMNKYKFNMRILIGMIAILLIMTTLYMVFADSNVVPIIIDENGVPYMYFELDHSLSNAQYKYYGYGYTVSVYEPGPNGALLANKYIQNAQFKPYMDGSTEKVWIPMHEIYGMVNLDDEFYSVRNMKVYLNGRLGIKVNGTLTHLYDSYDGVPENGLKETGLQTGYWKESLTVTLNKDGQGIKNGIEHEYGVSWSATTQKNLKQHFGIPLTVPSVYKYDRYRVEYREISSKKTVSSGKPYQNFNDFATITEHPVLVNGYEYAGQYMIKKIDTDNNEVTTDPYGDTQEGDSATINIKKNADRYIITFYYTKVDPSSIGKPVTVNIEYREDTFDGKKLLNSTTTIGGDLSQFNFNSAKIDNYNCIGYYAIGQSSEYFHDTNVSFIIGKENYSKPVNGSLKIIFIYEKIPYISIPKCSPSVDGDSDTVNISMKKKDFENAADISINNAVFRIEKFTAGKDADGNTVEGTHGFNFFDLYIDKYKSSYDNRSKEITQSFIAPKNIFTQSATDPNLYTTNINVKYAAFCTCFDGKPDAKGNYGMAIYDESLRVNINLIENKPPKALFDYYTEKRLEDGSKGQVSRAYINHETIIDNQATDPNGNDDIRGITYNLKDSKNNQYFINLLMVGNGTYFLEDDNLKADNIVFNGITDTGNLKLKFLTEETWTISQYVEDMDGLNDTYTATITPEILSLKSIAVITDTVSYRYPFGSYFGGKQNRVIKLNSNSSYVADFLKNTGVKINHSRDCWEIKPLDGQSLESIKLENIYNSEIIDGVLQVKYKNLNNVKMMFKEKGRYLFRLQVCDSDGNVSEWKEQIITIAEDIAPTINSNIPNIYYRNASTKNATIQFNALSVSTDEDYTEVTNIQYRFDSDNDNSFEDEAFSTENLTTKDVLIDGVIYRQVILVTGNVGNYQFYIKIKDIFGQETLDEYINESDYKTNNTYLSTEVDNLSPTGTLGIQKENNIDVKILTSGLSDTQDATVSSYVGTLKSLVESQYNIKSSEIEIVDMANTKDAKIAGNEISWRSVIMGLNTQGGNGLIDDKTSYIDKEYTVHSGEYDPLFGDCLQLLPTGVYATGWNGIELPHIWVQNGLWNDATKASLINHYAIDREYYIYPKDDIAYVLSNSYGVNYNANYIKKGYFGSYYGFMSNSDYTAITKEKIRDFDINIDYSNFWYKYHGIDDHCIINMFLFDVQDSDNYYAVYELNCNSDYCTYKSEYERHTGILFKHEGSYYPFGVVKVKNGKIEFLKEYSGKTKEDGRCPIQRVRKLGDTVTVYNDVGTQVIQFTVDDSFKGKSGYLGYGTQSSDLINSTMTIGSLTYLDNSNMYDAIDKLSWGSDTDKYIINIVADNAIDEMTNNEILRQTAAKLQTKGITLINVGVSSVNATRLNEIVAKSGGSGTYLELGSITTNLSSSASYIRNLYSNQVNADDYSLVGSTLKYSEGYSDTENDLLYSKFFMFCHEPSYFENNLGTISNNNTWVKQPIETFNKTGKYTIKYQVRDNPLGDTNEYNLFDEYRKYSPIYTRLLYVHRKPIASFFVDPSFANNILNYYNQTYSGLNFDMYPILIETETITDDSFSIPASAYDISLTIKTNYKAGTVSVDPNYGSTQSNYFSSGETYTFNLVDSATSVDLINLTMSKATVTLSYTTTGYTYVEESKDIVVNIPDDAIDAKFTYTSSDYDSSAQASVYFYADGVSIGSGVNDEVSHSIPIPSGTDILTITASDKTSQNVNANIYNMSIGYYRVNTSLTVPIIENSYDLDHKSLSNKGIVQWQWKVTLANGTSTIYDTTSRSNGITWVQNTLSTSTAWRDAIIMLKVKDAEGEWSDWTSTFISEDAITDPGTNNNDISVSPPIANFVLSYNEMNLKSQTQLVYDESSDPQGLALVYSWKVYKEGALILNSANDINNSLNEKILTNGTGTYTVKLKVTNSKGLMSNEVTKNFNVVLYNSAPTVNFDLVSNENPTWIFPKNLGLYTLNYRPSNTLFSEEYTRFDTYINDPSTDNTGFIYNWKLERFAVKNISNISGTATNTYSYTTQFPFTNSFKNQGLGWGAYKVTLKVTDKPPIPPYVSTDAKSAEITKYYYIVPETSIVGSFESSKPEVMVGDTITLKATTSKLVDSVDCIFNNVSYSLIKSSEDGNFIYWKKDIVIPDSITESGTYNINFIGKTTYGGNGNVTRVVKDNVPIDIISLKLINFRITNIVNHTNITFPYTKDMLTSNLIPYKTGYNVTFQIDSKGKPDNVYGRIDVGNNGTIDQNINLTKVVTGDTETWKGKFYTPSLLPTNTVISIKLDCKKGTTTYNYNEKENWDGRSLITNGSALQDGRINLTN